jgi:hypothetical protein
MAKQTVNIGSVPNDGTGDPLRTAMDKINDNFDEVYRAVGGVGSNTLLNMVSNNAIQVLGVYNPISFLLNDEAELYALNPSAYHGCIAHVHSTGAVYYAHQKWNKLLTDNANNDVTSYADSLANVAYTGNLLDLGIVDGSNGQVLMTDGNGTFTFETVVSGGGGGVASNTFSTIAVSGQTDVVAETTTDTLTLVAGSGITITTNPTTDTITFTANTSGGGVSGFTPTRVTQAVSTTSIADNASADIEFGNLGISYVLHKIAVDRASWVRIYADTSSRTADNSRLQGTDPIEGTGVIAEFISSAANTFLITPGVYGFVETGNTIPVRVTNLSGSTSAVAVTLTGLKLEE